MEEKNTEMVGELQMSPPWVTYWRELQALFEGDHDVDLKFNEDEYTIDIRVRGATKADALGMLLPVEKEFGNVTLHINVIPANYEFTKPELFYSALRDNPNFAFVANVPDVMSNPISYVVFKKKIAQFFNDNLGDVHGNTSMLYEDIARNVFDEHNGIFFCTDTNGENIGVKLGEWPRPQQ